MPPTDAASHASGPDSPPDEAEGPPASEVFSGSGVSRGAMSARLTYQQAFRARHAPRVEAAGTTGRETGPV